MSCFHSKNIIENSNYKTLQELQNEIKTFDLICFKDNDLISKTISKVQKIAFGNGDWTHVGIVIKTDILDFKNGKKNKIYVWESTISGYFGDTVLPENANRGKFGIQIRDFNILLNKYIKNNKTKIGWCKLINNPLDRRDIDTDISYQKRIYKIKKRIKKFYIKHGDNTYDYKILSFAKTIFPFISKNKYLNKLFHTKNLYFCSEMVTTIYKLIKIIDKSIDPENIAPIELLGYSNDNIGKIVNDPIFLRKN